MRRGERLPSRTGRRATRVYVAGPMRGIPHFNFPAFRRAARRLRLAGFSVWSPAERDLREGFNPRRSKPKSLKHYMAHDLAAVCRSDALLALPGWRRSVGAQLEVHVATACGIPLYDALTLLPIQETALQEAQRIVYGDRRADYGHPLDNFTMTVNLLNARFADILRPGAALKPEDFADIMELAKIAREANRHSRDNQVDRAGYAGTRQEVFEERARRERGSA